MTQRSKKQSVVTRFSEKVGFISMTLGICELLWLKSLLKELKTTNVSSWGD